MSAEMVPPPSCSEEIYKTRKQEVSFLRSKIRVAFVLEKKRFEGLPREDKNEKGILGFEFFFLYNNKKELGFVFH